MVAGLRPCGECLGFMGAALHPSRAVAAGHWAAAVPDSWPQPGGEAAGL